MHLANNVIRKWQLTDSSESVTKSAEREREKEKDSSNIEVGIQERL